MRVSGLCPFSLGEIVRSSPPDDEIVEEHVARGGAALREDHAHGDLAQHRRGVCVQAISILSTRTWNEVASQSESGFTSTVTSRATTAKPKLVFTWRSFASIGPGGVARNAPCSMPRVPSSSVSEPGTAASALKSILCSPASSRRSHVPPSGEGAAPSVVPDAPAARSWVVASGRGSPRRRRSGSEPRRGRGGRRTRPRASRARREPCASTREPINSSPPHNDVSRRPGRRTNPRLC